MAADVYVMTSPEIGSEYCDESPVIGTRRPTAPERPASGEDGLTRMVEAGSYEPLLPLRLHLPEYRREKSPDHDSTPFSNIRRRSACLWERSASIALLASCSAQKRI